MLEHNCASSVVLKCFLKEVATLNGLTNNSCQARFLLIYCSHKNEKNNSFCDGDKTSKKTNIERKRIFISQNICKAKGSLGA